LFNGQTFYNSLDELYQIEKIASFCYFPSYFTARIIRVCLNSHLHIFEVKDYE